MTDALIDQIRRKDEWIAKLTAENEKLSSIIRKIREEIEKEHDFIVCDSMTEQEIHYVEGMERALVIMDRNANQI